MKILAFSDWRVQNIEKLITYLENLEEKPDLVVYAGDDLERFNYPTYKSLPKNLNKYGLCAIAGNDDFPYMMYAIAGKNVYNIHEKPIHIDDFAFIGLEGATSEIGFLIKSEEEVKAHLNKMLNKVKSKNLIIVSHTPPFEILDFGIRFGSNCIGSTALKEFIEQNSDRVKLVICGHVHSQGGMEEKFRIPIIHYFLTSTTRAVILPIFSF